MKYINGKDVLPKQLLEQLQHYVQGKLLYVPRKENSRAGWGTLNGTRAMIRNRNREICRRYDEGATIQELMEGITCLRIAYERYLTRRPALWWLIDMTDIKRDGST